MGTKRTGVVLAAAATFVIGSAAFPGAALAAKSPDVTGTISLDTAMLKTVDGSSGLKYGDSAKFNTSVSGRMDARAYTQVSVVCIIDGRAVFQASAPEGTVFELVDQGDWLSTTWNGEAASCLADLVYRIDGQKPTVKTLASTEFGVAAAPTA